MYNALIVLFTGVLAVVGVLQWRVMREQSNWMKESFVAQFRPKLEIRSVVMIPAQSFSGVSRIEYVVANVGGSKASVLDGWVGFQEIEARKDGQLPTLPPYGAGCDIGVKWINAGQRCKLLFELPHEMGAQVVMANTEAFQQRRSSSGDNYFFGFIDYVDSIGTQRRAAFCRLYDLHRLRFVKTDNIDYEYSD